MAKQKEAPKGFDAGFEALLGETYGKAKRSSRIPKKVKANKEDPIKEQKTKIEKEEKKEPIAKNKEPQVANKFEKTENTPKEVREVSQKKDEDNLSQTEVAQKTSDDMEVESPEVVQAESEAEIETIQHSDSEEPMAETNSAAQAKETTSTIASEQIISTQQDLESNVADSESSQSLADTEPKTQLRFDDLIMEYDGEYYAQIYTRAYDRDFIRLIARFENVNINILTDNIIQAWLNSYKNYFEGMNYISFLEIKDNFSLENSSNKNPFSGKKLSKEKNTTMRVSYESAESMRNITTVENIASLKIFYDAVKWFKNQYAPILRKRKYYSFIKQYLKDVD